MTRSIVRACATLWGRLAGTGVRRLTVCAGCGGGGTLFRGTCAGVDATERAGFGGGTSDIGLEGGRRNEPARVCGGGGKFECEGCPLCGGEWDCSPCVGIPDCGNRTADI